MWPLWFLSPIILLLAAKGTESQITFDQSTCKLYKSTLLTALNEAVQMSNWAYNRILGYQDGTLTMPEKWVLYETLGTYFGSNDPEETLKNANALLGRLFP
jgi:hypothetical protein